MNRTIDYFAADPAGNITIFVLSRTDRRDYQWIARALLARTGLGAEQVAFIKSPGVMEMCGLEFCGNAARAFGLYTAIEAGLTGEQTIYVSVSGCEAALAVDVNTCNGFTRAAMPLPRSITRLTGTGLDLLEQGMLVDMDGILHLVLQDVKPSRQRFDELRGYLENLYAPPAVGVMFYDTASGFMTPVVYVRDVDTTYFEGSCASGTVAAAAALCKEREEGSFAMRFPQPAGILDAVVVKKRGVVRAVYIEGRVKLGPVMSLELVQ